MRKFVTLNQLKVNYCEEGNFYEDSVLAMTSVPLQRYLTGSLRCDIISCDSINLDFYRKEPNGAASSVSNIKGGNPNECKSLRHIHFCPRLIKLFNIL